MDKLSSSAILQARIPKKIESHISALSWPVFMSQNYTIKDYLSVLGLKLNHVCKGAPGNYDIILETLAIDCPIV